MPKKANKDVEVILATAIMGKKPGDIVKVKGGYARNYLIPSNLAMRLKGNELRIQANKEEWAKRDEENRVLAGNYLETLKQINLQMKVESGVGNTLYGSITGASVADILLKQYAVKVAKQDVVMNPIKLLGEYKVKVNLYGGLSVEIPLSVLPIGA